MRILLPALSVASLLALLTPAVATTYPSILRHKSTGTATQDQLCDTARGLGGLCYPFALTDSVAGTTTILAASIPALSSLSGVATTSQLPTGTSGATVPLLNGANTWSAAQTFTGGTNAPLVTPASSSAACATGDRAADASYIYVCTATNTWKRAALSAF